MREYPLEPDYDINDRGARVPAGRAGRYHYEWESGGGIGGVFDSNRVPIRQVAESEVRSPASMLAYGDSVLTTVSRGTTSSSVRGWVTSDPSLFSLGAFYDTEVQSRLVGSPSLGERRRGQAARHNGRFNSVFCDGHTESRTANQLFAPRPEVVSLWNRDQAPHP